MAHGKHISIWFFIGVLLLIYGVLIMGAGLAGVESNTTLSELHANIWWGALLVVLGLVYSIMFRPSKG